VRKQFRIKFFQKSPSHAEIEVDIIFPIPKNTDNSLKPSIAIFFLGLVLMVGILKYAITTTTGKRSCSTARAIQEWNSVITTSAETH